MIQMVFKIIGTALKKKNNVTLLAKKGQEDLCYGFTFDFGSRSNLVFMKGRKNYKDYISQKEIELLPYESNFG